MKTLMQMFAEQDKGVIFFESCINLKHQKHTCIEAIPVPFELFDELPAYFQVCPPSCPPCSALTLTTGSDRQLGARMVSAQEAHRLHSRPTLSPLSRPQPPLLCRSVGLQRRKGVRARHRRRRRCAGSGCRWVRVERGDGGEGRWRISQVRSFLF